MFILMYIIIIICCRADIALIGLAVMGQNIILNMNDHGFVVGLTHLHHISCISSGRLFLYNDIIPVLIVS